LSFKLELLIWKKINVVEFLSDTEWSKNEPLNTAFLL